ncbi:hypothetical protein QTP70_029255 [Hemibagrus guttatus]|uniref:Chemokine interleukin-8-like domain-containing protein n=1 Tax=Hemibagrus guttatus TaxID=175788 RepID=A0AAE0QZ81_9TELE|nr:hypothetical protein QTP70_029255 [Hemibagrus guttatus]
MKTLTALLFLMSLYSLQLVFSAPAGLDHNTSCCPGTITKKIPLKIIVNYWWTSNDCPIEAIVFETHNKVTNIKNKICVDPTADWVEKHIRAVDKKNNDAVSQQTSQSQQ